MIVLCYTPRLTFLCAIFQHRLSHCGYMSTRYGDDSRIMDPSSIRCVGSLALRIHRSYAAEVRSSPISHSLTTGYPIRGIFLSSNSGRPDLPRLAPNLGKASPSEVAAYGGGLYLTRLVTISHSRWVLKPPLSIFQYLIDRSEVHSDMGFINSIVFRKCSNI
jgi:hypothetical protein